MSVKAILPDWTLIQTEQARKALQAAFEAFDMGRKWSGLTETEEQVWQAILLSYSGDGVAPDAGKLATIAGLSEDRLRAALQSLRDRDLIVLAPDGRITGAYPFTDASTGHRVVVRDVVVSAMCAIDALGIGAMLSAASEVTSACRHCGTPIYVTLGGAGDVLEAVAPRAAVVWSGTHYGDACGATSLCTVQAFFCSDKHLSAWLDDEAQGFRLSPNEALQVGRAIFAPMLRRREVRLQSTITCPQCGAAKVEQMPTDACQFFYDCTACGLLMRPKPKDCCVFCSYGDVPCPPIQERTGLSKLGCCG